MTPIDKKLFEFFEDLSDMENHKDNYVGIKKIYDECSQFINNKSYSDINIQDEKGNTFIHYAFYSMKQQWIEKLLTLGADPTIENHKHKNCFHMPRSYGYTYQFHKNYESIYFDTFKEKTQGYCHNFKNILLSNCCEQRITHFKTCLQIEDFLKDNDLYSSKNKLVMLGCSIMINPNTKMGYYLDNFNSPEDNSYFFHSICTKHGLNLFSLIKDKQMIAEFFSRTFANNDTFSWVATKIIEKSEEKKQTKMLTPLFEIIFSQSMDLNRPINNSIHNIADDIKKTKFVNSIYQYAKLNWLLEKELSIDKLKQKTHKI